MSSGVGGGRDRGQSRTGRSQGLAEAVVSVSEGPDRKSGPSVGLDRVPLTPRDASSRPNAHRQSDEPRTLRPGARAIAPRLDGRWAKCPAGVLASRQLELERWIEGADLADDALEVLFDRRIRLLAPGRVQIGRASCRERV